MTQSIRDKEAVRIFIQRMRVRAYDGVIESTLAMLEQGPPGRKPRPVDSSLHRWYRELDEQGREQVAALVRETAEAAVFGCLVVLDNATGGPPLEGQVSDLALYLQTYESAEHLVKNMVQSSLRLNPPNRVDGDLHDEFLLSLQDEDS